MAIKDKQKQKKYEEELAKIQAEYEETREKDDQVLDAKIKHEIQYAIIGLAEKRYKAEAEVEELKKKCDEKDKTIEEMRKQIEALNKENQQLKERVELGGSYKQSNSP